MALTLGSFAAGPALGGPATRYEKPSEPPAPPGPAASPPLLSTTDRELGESRWPERTTPIVEEDLPPLPESPATAPEAAPAPQPVAEIPPPVADSDWIAIGLGGAALTAGLGVLVLGFRRRRQRQNAARDALESIAFRPAAPATERVA